MDQKTAEALELLFRYYVEELFYDEQWSTADDLVEEFLKCAKNPAYVRELVIDNLDYDLTFEQEVPETEEIVKQRMLEKLNGHAKAKEIAEAAVLVWNEL